VFNTVQFLGLTWWVDSFVSTLVWFVLAIVALLIAIMAERR